MFKNKFMAEIEALLFVAGEAVPIAKIASALELTQEEIHELLNEMEQLSAAEYRGLMLRRVAGGVQMCTKPEHSQLASSLLEIRESKLSAAALEVLAIVAFRQPITRQEVEALRGVNSDRGIATLEEKKLIRELGRREAPGRPVLYGTSESFLYCFGLESLSDIDELTFQQQSLI